MFDTHQSIFHEPEIIYPDWVDDEWSQEAFHHSQFVKKLLRLLEEQPEKLDETVIGLKRINQRNAITMVFIWKADRERKQRTK